MKLIEALRLARRNGHMPAGSQEDGLGIRTCRLCGKLLLDPRGEDPPAVTLSLRVECQERGRSLDGPRP